MTEAKHPTTSVELLGLICTESTRFAPKKGPSKNFSRVQSFTTSCSLLHTHGRVLFGFTVNNTQECPASKFPKVPSLREQAHRLWTSSTTTNFKVTMSSAAAANLTMTNARPAAMRTMTMTPLMLRDRPVRAIAHRTKSKKWRDTKQPRFGAGDSLRSSLFF